VPAPAKPSRRWRKRALAASIALILFLLAGEGFLRLAVFSSWARGMPQLTRWCEPSLWGDPQYDDNYWITRAYLIDRESRLDSGGHHPEIGWGAPLFDSSTFRHLQEAEIHGRRPILLYGDSYAQCNTSAAACWQGILQRSALFPHAFVLNYGVGGYGADQVLLLMERSIDLYAERAPLVVVALMVDDDFDRAALSVRGRPKPRMHLENGRLSAQFELAQNNAAFFRGGGPLGRGSLLAALWRYQFPRLFRRWEQRRTLARDLERQALSRAILQRMAEVVGARKLPLVFVVFNHYPSLMDPAMSGWREPLLVEEAARLGVPCLVPREGILAKAKQRGLDPVDLYGGTPELEGHWNELGNEIVFDELFRTLLPHLGLQPAVREALERAPSEQFLNAFPSFEAFEPLLRGSLAAVRYEVGRWQPFMSMEEVPRLILRVGEEGPVEAQWDLGGALLGLRFRTTFFPLNEVPPSGAVRLELFGDDRSLLQRQLLRDGPSENIMIDLRGVQRLRLVVGDGGDGHEGDWLVLLQPTFY
jgi:hypothetical protein